MVSRLRVLYMEVGGLGLEIEGSKCVIESEMSVNGTFTFETFDV